MPKIIDHDQRREDIIDVTWQLIVEGGIEAATMREIAKRAGFANGALKHYFERKDDIIEGAYERALQRIGDLLAREVEGKRGLEALEISLRFTLPTNSRTEGAERVLLSFWERCAFNTDLDHHYGRHLDNWKAGYLQYLREGREDGEVRTPVPDPQLVSEVVLMNIGATVTRAVSPEHYDAEVIEQQISDFVARLRQGPTAA